MARNKRSSVIVRSVMTWTAEVLGVALFFAILVTAIYLISNSQSSSSTDSASVPDVSSNADGTSYSDPTTTDPTTTASKGRQYTEADFTTDAKATFITVLKTYDPTYAAMSDSELVHLGAQVCTFRSRGDSSAAIIAVITSTTSSSNLTATRLVHDANAVLCGLND